MQTTVQKWGNSHAIRIPKAIMQMAKIEENDKISIEVKDGNIVILPIKKHKSLDDRIREYESSYECKEWDTGKPLGKEIF